MAEELLNTEKVSESLPSRRERHQSSKRRRKTNLHQTVQTESVQAESVTEGHEHITGDDEDKKGPERSQIFKRERERQGSIYIATFIFWLFILLVGSLLFFTIRHYSG